VISTNPQFEEGGSRKTLIGWAEGVRLRKPFGGTDPYGVLSPLDISELHYPRQWQAMCMVRGEGLFESPQATGVSRACGSLMLCSSACNRLGY